MLSVVPRVKTISSALAAPRYSATRCARVLVSLGRAGAQLVQAAMHVGVVVLVVVPQRIEHRARLLRGGGVVEIDQRLACTSWSRIGKSSRIAGQSMEAREIWCTT